MKRPAERRKLDHTQSFVRFLLAPQFPSACLSRHPGAPMRIVLWREKDAMRQCKISFGVIRRLFDGQKEPISPHRGQEYSMRFFRAGPERFRGAAWLPVLAKHTR